MRWMPVGSELMYYLDNIRPDMAVHRAIKPDQNFWPRFCSAAFEKITGLFQSDHRQDAFSPRKLS
jgi:hypothetical protein